MIIFAIHYFTENVGDAVNAELGQLMEPLFGDLIEFCNFIYDLLHYSLSFVFWRLSKQWLLFLVGGAAVVLAAAAVQKTFKNVYRKVEISHATGILLIYFRLRLGRTLLVC